MFGGRKPSPFHRLPFRAGAESLDSWDGSWPESDAEHPSADDLLESPGLRGSQGSSRSFLYGMEFTRVYMILEAILLE